MCLKQSGAQEENKATGTSKHLPKETGICSCILATMYLYEYHNEHGIKADRAVVQHFATDTIMIKKANVIQSFGLTRCSVSQLQLLNPLQIEYHSFYNDESLFEITNGK
jgi:membrane-bound lytic murein transglycosylase D